jgi:hypothetical protein
LVLLLNQLDPREQDRRAIRALIRDTERALRAHDGSAWLLVERGFPPAEKHPALEPGHEQLLRDLDRLAHLEDVQLTITAVTVTGEIASADYQVLGRARPKEAVPPAAGRFAFRRTGDGWTLVGNFFEEIRSQGSEQTNQGRK